jgi:hypothetical protein
MKDTEASKPAGQSQVGGHCDRWDHYIRLPQGGDTEICCETEQETTAQADLGNYRAKHSKGWLERNRCHTVTSAAACISSQGQGAIAEFWDGTCYVKRVG